MGKSTPQTKTTNATSSTGPWAPSQDVLKGILGQGSNLLPQASQTTALQQQGINSLGTAANQAGQYSPDLQSLTQTLFGGGNYGQGDAGVASALSQTNANLSPYANGSMIDPTKNPAYAGLADAIKYQARNAIGSQFAGSGRSGDSGAYEGAMGDAVTRGLAPFLFNAAQQNQQDLFGANQALNSNALGAAGQYNSSAGGALGAQLQAPGSLANLGIPGQMQLAAGGAPLQTSVGNLGTLSNLLLPIAGLGQQGTTSGTQVATPAQGSMLQQVLGGILGGAGILGQGGAFKGLFGG